MRGFICQRCDKFKDIDERAIRIYHKTSTGICVSCSKKMGIYKSIESRTLKKKSPKKKRKKGLIVRTEESYG